MPAAPLVIAIDGPSGSGKSSVSREVARRLGLTYLDTGATYRAVTWSCLEAGIPLEDAAAVAAHTRSVDLRMGTDPVSPTVYVGSQDVTTAIRESRISAVVSVVAQNLDVRAELRTRQRAIIEAAREAERGCVAEGRDITTVVAPDADVRLLLTASAEARLARRSLELHGSDDASAVDRTRDEVLRRDADDSAVATFHVAADGVLELDSSALDFEQTVVAVLEAVASAVGGKDAMSDAPGIDRALRAGLDDYDLSDEDLALLEGGEAGAEDEDSGPLPVLAVVGRPNVGKSTLVNRVLGRREAVVQDVPGVTRDRVSYEANWAGRRFMVVDTGGWERDVRGLAQRVAEQAEIAVQLADAVMFVVDAGVGATDTDEAVVKLLRRSGKPVVLAANKVDDLRGEADASALWSLGLGEPHPVSGLHGRGSGDLLDAVLQVLPPVSAVGEAAETGLRRVALLGKPNVGKSSLLNSLAGSERVVVDAVAGTTRDPVDEVIQLGGRPWRFVDTAGIRRKVRQTEGADFYASLRTQAALEKAEVAVVLLDASEPLTEQDTRVIQMVVDTGRALVLAYNKWDLVDEERRRYLEREYEQDLVQVQWARRVNISARTRWHVDRLVPALDTALESWDTRVPTGRLNQLLAEIQQAHPHPVRGGKQPRILFGTQARSRPPRFVLFTTGFFDPGYRRYVERRLRETFGFEGTPIEVSVRPREKRRR